MKANLGGFKKWAVEHKKALIATTTVTCIGTAAYLLHKNGGINRSNFKDFDRLKELFDMARHVNKIEDIPIDPEFADHISELWKDGEETTAIMFDLTYEELPKYLEYFKSIDPNADDKFVNIIIGFVPNTIKQ